MNHIKPKIISNFNAFSKVFFKLLLIVFICNLIFEDSTIINADENSKEKTVFLAFDMNYKDQEELETSKDIINQILKYYSKNLNVEVVFQPYGSKSYDPQIITLDNHESILSEFFNSNSKESYDLFSNHYLIISEAFTKIAENLDTTDSELFIISNLRINKSEEYSRVKLSNLSDLYLSSGIKFNVMSLQSATADERNLFIELSANTGGSYVDFGSSSAMVEFLKLFMDNPISILQTNLTPKPLSNFINIPPTVNRIKVGFYRQDNTTEVSVINPNGLEIKPKIDYDYWHLSKILFLDILEPESGTWTIITNGNSGRFEIITDTYNPLSLATQGEKVFSSGSPVILEVGAFIEGKLSNIQNAEMQLRVRDNNGSETIQIMNDLGQKMDKEAFDGIYTVELSPFLEQSILDLEYTLQWKDVSTPVVHNDQIKIEYFPEIEITKISDLKGRTKDEFNVITFETRVNSYPYLVSLDEIQSIIIPNDNFSFRIEKVNLKDTDKSYIFNLFLESEEKIKGEVIFDLNIDTNYLEKEYKSSIKKIQINVNTKYLYILGLRYYYWIAIFIAITITLILILNNLRQTKITGYLTDTQNNIIVDFSTIKRNPISKFLYPKRIDFISISQLPYSGGYFEFVGDEVYINIQPIEGDPSIRINSIPANGKSEITNGPWIGSSGKQVRFRKNIPYIDV
tara:strand:- start:4035 stop:6089 length:2055 start_codon:yes stop_codon:yes gene_type:complete